MSPRLLGRCLDPRRHLVSQLDNDRKRTGSGEGLAQLGVARPVVNDGLGHDAVGTGKIAHTALEHIGVLPQTGLGAFDLVW